VKTNLVLAARSATRKRKGAAFAEEIDLLLKLEHQVEAQETLEQLNALTGEVG
jgi:hypothetical protein